MFDELSSKLTDTLRRLTGRGVLTEAAVKEGLRDIRLLHVRMTGVEHPHLMAELSQDGREGLDAQGRETHHLDSLISRFRAAEFFRQQPVEIFVSHVNEEYFHGNGLSRFGSLRLEGFVAVTREP